MNTMLKELILQKCRKVSSLEYVEEEEREDVAEEEPEFEPELPFEDILADKRRKYSIKEEYIYLLYNDILKYFWKEWDGKYLRKKPKKIIDDDDDDDIISDEECIGEEEYYEEEIVVEEKKNDNFEECISDTSKTNMDLSWKLKLPDEFANITFINNNTYSGRISRKMMEGEGVYRWINGAQYKGTFEQNLMHGKGLLEWNNVCWYEGDFINGYRHGRGMMVDGENHYMYTGQWHKGLRHGKGYARYEDNGSYDGDWVMDKMNGIGLRIYPSGARYVGQWKNGIRDGIGTMVWTNGNFYRGEWKCGSMHGYGEHVWNGFFNRTFTWPQEASYSGYWRHGLRHGKGDMKFNSVGGAKYSGYWKDNKKHGYGIIFGNNGEKFEANPLFLNDILCTDIMKDNKDNNNLENESEVKDKDECIITDVKPKFIEKPAELAKGFVTPILKPEQFPYLTYYITRLLDPESLEPRFEPSISSGRCYICENESCACLHVPSKDIVINEIVNEIDQNDFPQEQLFKSDVIDVKKSEWNYEECWIYKCLMIHIVHLRQIYNDYAKLFANPAPKCNLVMSRLCLWQLWRDCNIQKKMSLSEIDVHIAKNKSTMVKDPHYPFEKIEIWQFLHALLEVSWHLYTKYNNIEVGEMNGKLANGLHKFLKNDIYPYVGNHVGTLCNENKDILPMNCVFEFYRQIGYPPSARDLLQSTCILNAKDSRLFATTTESMKIFPEGINSVTIGEKISYLLKINEIFTLHNYTTDISKKNENNLINKLLIFNQLGAVKMIEVMTLICPGIKDTNTGIIINMDYKLTFLEFYEIILEATKELLFLKNKSEKLLQMKIEKEIKSVEINNL